MPGDFLRAFNFLHLLCG